MNLNTEQLDILNDQDRNEIKVLKRKLFESDAEPNKKIIPISHVLKNENNITSESTELRIKQNCNRDLEERKSNDVEIVEFATKVPISPKKRLNFSNLRPKKEKFIYGNYSQYYGYRNKGKDFHDIRLDVFREHQEIFKNKEVLDIGCNSGFITMEVAKQYDLKSITGIDIDKSLINQSIKNLTKLKKSLPMENEMKRLHKFPFNVMFVHGNYVLKDDVLLEIERAQFDVILCLSVTKWIHLNFGDKGLKQAFKRMFLQLKSDGKLILEAQPFDNYSRRKKMTDTIFENYKHIKFFPEDFTEYLLSGEVGFSKVDLMGVPDHCTKGFKRPINIFTKC